MNKPKRTTYAADLNAYMHDVGLNGVSLGALVGVSKMSVSEWRRGISLPNEAHQRAIYRLSEGRVPMRCPNCSTALPWSHHG